MRSLGSLRSRPKQPKQLEARGWHHILRPRLEPVPILTLLIIIVVLITVLVTVLIIVLVVVLITVFRLLNS